MHAQWAYVNGDYVAIENAQVSAFDHGFLYGDGCFEGIVVVNGRVLHIDQHVERLLDSVKYLRIDLGLNAREVREIILTTASKNNLAGEGKTGYLRPVVTRGVGPIGVSKSLELVPTFVVLPQIGERSIAFGDGTETLEAVTTQYTTFPASCVDPAVKANQYIPNVLAFIEAKSRGADVGILRATDGYVSEGYGMNIFVISKGEIYTPHRNTVLRGITRRFVIDCAEEAEIPVQERNLSVYDLITADELFVTSSMNSVAAISRMDGVVVGDGAAGPITRKIRAAYLAHAQRTGTLVP